MGSQPNSGNQDDNSATGDHVNTPLQDTVDRATSVEITEDQEVTRSGYVIEQAIEEEKAGSLEPRKRKI